MSGELPKGWKSARIETIAEAHMGETILAKQLTLTGLPVYSAGQENTPWGFLEQPKKPLGDGTVVISARGSIGFPKIPKAERFASTQTTIALHFPNKKLAAFACLWLKTVDWNGLTRGGAIPMLTVGNINELTMPLPPEVEQRRIVAKLEKLLGKVDDCQKRLSKIPMILKRFRQAVLSAACSGRLTADWREDNQTEDLPEGSELPPGWRWMPIKELLPPGGIFDGPFGSNLKTADYTDNGVQVVRLENVGSLQFFHQKETYISQEKYKILSKHTVGVGDIIFASFIDEEVRACVLPKLKTKAIAKADCFCLRPRQEVVNRHYLTFQLVSRESYERLSESIHGATRPRINTTQLRNLEVRICPLAEQQEIVRRVESMFKLADAVERRVAVATARVEKLTQAILAKAFRGELVPTEAELARREGRSYETASELLARIKSDRDSKQASQRVRRNRN